MANDIPIARQGSVTPQSTVVAETASGKLRGEQAGGVHSFKGVPYGASTAGRNRFRAPQPPAAWAGVRDALGYGPRAWQLPDRPKRRAGLDTLLGPADTMPESEDCLTLNVWTPGLDTAAKRPVMVWLHGGAFAYGSGNRAVTNGGNLARRGDVVVVSVNHRLNIFGFLHLGDVAGADWAQSGNAGMLDIVAALRWVRDNVAAFGGDPGNVTIFGESGGGGKVSVLLAMPEAKGLFHRAIVQSGAAIRVSTRERATVLAEAVLHQLGLNGHECAALQQLPPERVAAAIAPVLRAAGRSPRPLLDRYDFGPVVDGRDLPQHPADPTAPPSAAGIPLLIGGTREESAFFLADDDAVWNGTLSETELRRRIGVVAGAETEALLAVYAAAMPGASPADRLIAALTGGNFWIRTVLFAERYAERHGAPVYMYSLDWQSPAHRGRLKAHHAMDLPFVFDNPDVAGTTAGAAGARELAARIAASWIAFARNGRPDNPAIPDWPAYDPAERATMIFDQDCRVIRDPGRDARRLWSRVAAAGA
ncbi:MAG TPA: carboxylesterase/lipase family protein [Stellaceae bacterium]|nr:carboxylesterase/lipase family protein [Stellaceae bacterium]